MKSKNPTRKERVLKVLNDHKWHFASELTTQKTGGSEGLRRVRELRAEGYPIEGPKTVRNRATKQYRLAIGAKRSSTVSDFWSRVGDGLSDELPF